MVDKIYPKSIAEAITNHHVTCVMGIAPIYENLLEVLGHHTYDVSSLRIPESGGMYTRIELIEKFKESWACQLFQFGAVRKRVELPLLLTRRACTTWFCWKTMHLI